MYLTKQAQFLYFRYNNTCYKLISIWLVKQTGEQFCTLTNTQNKGKINEDITLSHDRSIRGHLYGEC